MQHTLVFTKTSINVSKCGCIPKQESCLHSSAFCHKLVCAYNRNLLLHLLYRWYISRGKKFRKFRILERIIHRKQKIYIVYTLFLTDSRNFNPVKYTPYMVFEIIQYKALSTCNCMLDKEYIKK